MCVTDVLPWPMGSHTPSSQDLLPFLELITVEDRVGTLTTNSSFVALWMVGRLTGCSLFFWHWLDWRLAGTVFGWWLDVLVARLFGGGIVQGMLDTTQRLPFTCIGCWVVRCMLDTLPSYLLWSCFTCSECEGFKLCRMVAWLDGCWVGASVVISPAADQVALAVVIHPILYFL